jgi:hypothetical protein
LDCVFCQDTLVANEGSHPTVPGLHTVRNYVSDATSTTRVFVLLKHRLKAVVVAPPTAEHFLALISSHIQTFRNDGVTE